jgi:hypothetical protein
MIHSDKFDVTATDEGDIMIWCNECSWLEHYIAGADLSRLISAGEAHWNSRHAAVWEEGE